MCSPCSVVRRASKSFVLGKSTLSVVHTNKGNIRGIQVQGVDSYLGIPYAAAPVGALRWKPPQPRAPGCRSMCSSTAGGLVNGSSNQHDGTSIVAQTGRKLREIVNRANFA